MVRKMTEECIFVRCNDWDALYINNEKLTEGHSIPKHEWIKMINDLKAPIHRFRHMILSKNDMARQSNLDHILMLDAIRKHDADGVEKLVKEHILRGKAAVLELLESSQTGIENE